MVLPILLIAGGLLAGKQLYDAVTGVRNDWFGQPAGSSVLDGTSASYPNPRTGLLPLISAGSSLVPIALVGGLAWVVLRGRR